jgi:DNA-binding transcriptional MocR family regulator
VCVTNGSSDANAKAFEMLIDPDDHVLVENPTYRCPKSSAADDQCNAKCNANHHH